MIYMSRQKGFADFLLLLSAGTLIILVSAVWLIQNQSATFRPLLVCPTVTPSSAGAGSSVGSGITFEQERKIRRPFPPQNVRAIRLSDGSTQIEWFDADPLNRCFRAFRRETTGYNWVEIGQVKTTSGQEMYFLVDKSAREHTNYVYVVTAVNVYGNESEHSQIVYTP